MAETPRPPAPETVAAGRPGGLGTFGGVYTPSILTILGVIMYLRFGWVVGNVGLAGTLLIVTLATSITFLTGLSIAEIATDQRVRTGGAYYMISRSLGIETGGAVGIPLYFAQALSVALYTVGFAESLARAFPAVDEKLAGIVTTVAVAALALWSARIAIRAQYFIMAAIALSLASLVLGKPIESTTIELWGVPASASASFWQVFAVFFPAVTGIMAGVNMSGDLRDPARSIPRGTLAAIGTGYVIYMALPVLLASRADASTLVADPLVMRRMALFGDAILLGVWGATLSSAVGSILGAPRVLQALARDGILPSSLAWLGRGSGSDDEPRLGTVVTLGVALLAVALGSLDLIAPVLTMFFLTTYGVLNVAAGIERFLASPSFRPTFRVPWVFSLLGAVGCLWVMILINPVATAVAAGVVLAIFLWLERRELATTWGDVRRGLWMSLTRAGLLHLKSDPMDPKNWRPHLLVLSGAPTRRWHLIELASALTHGRGLVTVATVLPASQVGPRRAKAMEATIGDYLASRGVQSLVRVTAADDTFLGAEHLVRDYGLGAIRPNTILLGDSEEAEVRREYCRMVAGFHAARRNVLIVRHEADRGFGRCRRIDVWWGGLQANGGLMVLLAHLLQASLPWRHAELVLKMVVPSEAAAAAARANLAGLVARARIDARVEVIAAGNGGFPGLLATSSRDADLVFLGLAPPGEGFTAYYERLQRLAAPLAAPVVFTLAAEDLAFGEVLVE